MLSPNRSYLDRVLSKMSAGSMSGSIFTFSAAAIGAGVLALPYVFAQSGYVLGIIFMLTGAIAALWSNKLLAHAAIESKSSTYSEVAEKAGGKPLAALL